MKAQTVDVKVSTGRVLCCTVFRPGGKKLLAKGHVISDDDIRILESEGMDKVWVTELEDGEVGEDDAVSAVAGEMGCGCYEIHLAAGGRANLHATENCCVLVDEELLRQINCTSSVVIATSLNFSFGTAGQRIATVKSAPFAVAKNQLEAVTTILRERGPIIQARPIRDTTDASVSRALQHLLRSKPTLILIASTTAPAGPEDVIGRAVRRIGGQLERFLAPVEPGNLFMLAYKDEVPIISAPGCFRSAKPNVVDLILPPVLARYRVTNWEVACLGHGGLLG
jgi:molybdenum cofactor cytidylyltransferase